MAATVKIPVTWTSLNTLSGLDVGAEFIVQNVGKPGDVIECIVAATAPLETVQGFEFDQLKEVYRIAPVDPTYSAYVRFRRIDGGATYDRKGLLNWQSPSELQIEPVGALAPDLFSRTDYGFRRVKTENITLAQRYITDGLGEYFEWYEPSIPAGQSVYVEFTVPLGFFMALDSRELVARKNDVFYRVYPSGTYTVAVNNGPTGLLQGRLRNDAGLLPVTADKVTLSVVPTFNQRLLQVPAFGQEAAGTGAKASGDIAAESAFRLLAPGSVFLLELANAGSAASAVQLSLVYALLPEVAIPAPVV